MEVVSKEEFALWKDNKVTKVITDMLEEVKAANIDYVVSGGTLKDGDNATASYVGIIKGINIFLDIEVVEEADSYEH